MTAGVYQADFAL